MKSLLNKLIIFPAKGSTYKLLDVPDSQIRTLVEDGVIEDNIFMGRVQVNGKGPYNARYDIHRLIIL